MKQTLSFLLLFVALSTFSQDTDTTTQRIDQVVITAFRADLRTPVTFKNLELKDIEVIYVGQEPAALLNFTTPSFTSTSDAGNQFGYSNFRIRGIDQTRINVTMDGIPLNEPEDQGVYFNNYPDFFNSVNSIQIQRGVGTSTNGTSAYGGSINVESFDVFRAKKNLVAQIGYGSFNTGRLSVEYSSGKNEKGYAAYVRASSVSTDGYIDNAFHRGRSAFYSIGREWGSNQLKLVGFVGNQENGMAWLGATQDMIDESATSNGNNPNEVDNFTNALNSIQYQKVWDNTKLNATVYYNYLNGNYDIDLSHFGDSTTQNIALQHNFVGAFVNATHYINRGKVTVGIQGSQFDREHRGTFTGIYTDYVNTGFRNTFSAFVKAEYDVFERLRLFVDVQQRVTDFTYEGSAEMPKQDWSFTNYRGGLNYQINKRYAVYYSFGQTSREPTRNDLFGGFDDLWIPEGEEFATIEPESVQDHEFGFKFNGDRLAFQANGYFMSFTNEITLLGAVGPNGLALSGNVDNSYRMGAEFDITYKIMEDLDVFTQFTQSQNRIIFANEEVSHVLTPETIVNVGANYICNKWRFGVLAKHQGDSYLDIANTEHIDGFTVINMNVSFADGPFIWSLWVNNVTNQTYNASGTIGAYGEPRYFRQAPTNVFFSVAITL